MSSGFGSGSVGWDAPLPTESAFSTADVDAATHALIDKTRDVKVDANDYSRFKSIGETDSDGESKSKSKTSAVAPANDNCRNCHKPNAKLKCSVCKKAVYCARSCQASDWTFHKRICKKPEPPKKDPPRRPPPSSSTSSSSSSSATTSSAPKFEKPSSSAAKKNASSTEVVLDEPDLPSDVRGYKNGLPYFHRELSHDEKKLIGDIAPQKIEVAPAVAAAPTAHEGSAWNTAGTFEERTFTKWAEQKWSDLFTGAAYSEEKFTATFSAPEKVTGDASICVVRGKKRFLYDFNFTLPFEVSIGGGTIYKGKYTMNEISNDEDYEISGRLTNKPSSAADATALQKFIGTTNSGLQCEVLRIIGQFTQEFQQQ
uniref:MYND-type domain-containing protein n=1 Tax=Globisporangium ultimum (strain ATCC 200006 / CBS 805.95 / DAOM BR144) TaxID=431595 RepID=K3W7J9_GLOUD